MNKKSLAAVAAIIGGGILLGAIIIGGAKKKSDGGAEPAASAQTSHESENGAGGVGKEGKEGKDTKDVKGGKEGKDGKEGKVPHGGKIYADGETAVEVVLAELGGASRYRLYLSENGKPVSPANGAATMVLTRPAEAPQAIGFTAEKDFLQSAVPIDEPHVFSAQLKVRIGKQNVAASFEKEEGQVKLTDAQVKDAGISIEVANATRIDQLLRLPGEIGFNQDRTTQVAPRVAGVVKSVSASLGKQVKKGEVLATISSSTMSDLRSELLASQQRNALAVTTYQREKKLWEEKISAQQDYLQAQQALRETEIAVRNAQQKLAALGATPVGKGELSLFEVRAPFDGTVTEKHIALGEVVKEDAAIFVVTDLSSVWAQIIVSAKDLNVVRVGARAGVMASAFDSKAAGTVSYVGALLGEQTRSATARVTLGNPQLVWRPGMFVNVDIVTGSKDAPVTVSAEALQSINDKPSIFVRIPGGFIAQPVTMGISDGKRIEIVDGVKAGSQYASKGSFVLKAELDKASLEND